MCAGALNLLVFREDRRRVLGRELKSALMRQFEDLRGRSSLENVTRALLRAGELECAVADAGAAPARPHMSTTDRLAEALVAPGFPVDSGALQTVLADAAAPDVVEVSPAEGFAYYALHPLAFAGVLENIPSLPARVAVVGIRSIGSTLSAVTAAAARARGIDAERITVRPGGHPYNRRARFSPAQLEFVQQHVACGAAFWIVDEGPGLSGSSFLSVAEALEETGVSREKIVLVCGHQPHFDSLRTDCGPQRAGKFRWIAVSPEPRLPAGAELFVGGGEWREPMFPDRREWPASWIGLERLKYLSASDGGPRRLFKFTGLGHYGEPLLDREEKVAAAAFGPSPRRESLGFASYPWLRGRPMSAADLSDCVLARLAAYCAFRARAFAADLADLNALEQMAEHNLRAFGIELPIRLRLERPVVADGRMQPHEWLLTPEDQMLKADSGSHGDDHFFPGLTDIAWDLAGAIVEWRMNAAQAEFFLEVYRRASRDDARLRITDFIAAYTVFRWAYCRMAANALHGSEEQARLERAEADYRALFSRFGSAAVPGS